MPHQAMNDYDLMIAPGSILDLAMCFSLQKYTKTLLIKQNIKPNGSKNIYFADVFRFIFLIF